MIPAYAKELAHIWDWINDKYRQLCRNVQIILNPNERNQVRRNLEVISNGVQHEYLFYSQELPSIKGKLFRPCLKIGGIPDWADFFQARRFDLES